jgi:hypothetical protein
MHQASTWKERRTFLSSILPLREGRQRRFVLRDRSAAPVAHALLTSPSWGGPASLLRRRGGGTTSPERVKYSIEDTFQVRIDFIVPNADDCETIGLQFQVARFVSQRLASLRVLTPIELDNHPWAIAGKIDNEAFDRSLPPKAKSELSQFAQI